MWNPERIRDRLAALASSDPEFRRFGAARHRYRSRPVLSEGEIAAFETRHGVRLPEDYRTFLARFGDGGAGPYYGLIPLDGVGLGEYFGADRSTPGLLATRFPHTTSPWNPYDELGEDEYLDQRWVAGTLIVCEFGCAAFHRLVVTGPARGQVWFDDRASDGGLTRVADGFAPWYEAWLANPPPLPAGQ